MISDDIQASRESFSHILARAAPRLRAAPHFALLAAQRECVSFGSDRRVSSAGRFACACCAEMLFLVYICFRELTVYL